eukprot:403375328
MNSTDGSQQQQQFDAQPQRNVRHIKSNSSIVQMTTQIQSKNCSIWDAKEQRRAERVKELKHSTLLLIQQKIADNLQNEQSQIQKNLTININGKKRRGTVFHQPESQIIQKFERIKDQLHKQNIENSMQQVLKRKLEKLKQIMKYDNNNENEQLNISEQSENAQNCFQMNESDMNQSNASNILRRMPNDRSDVILRYVKTKVSSSSALSQNQDFPNQNTPNCHSNFDFDAIQQNGILDMKALGSTTPTQSQAKSFKFQGLNLNHKSSKSSINQETSIQFNKYNTQNQGNETQTKYSEINQELDRSIGSQASQIKKLNIINKNNKNLTISLQQKINTNLNKLKLNDSPSRNHEDKIDVLLVDSNQTNTYQQQYRKFLEDSFSFSSAKTPLNINNNISSGSTPSKINNKLFDKIFNKINQFNQAKSFNEEQQNLQSTSDEPNQGIQSLKSLQQKAEQLNNEFQQRLQLKIHRLRQQKNDSNLQLQNSEQNQVIINNPQNASQNDEGLELQENSIISKSSTDEFPIQSAKATNTVTLKKISQNKLLSHFTIEIEKLHEHEKLSDQYNYPIQNQSQKWSPNNLNSSQYKDDSFQQKALELKIKQAKSQGATPLTLINNKENFANKPASTGDSSPMVEVISPYIFNISSKSNSQENSPNKKHSSDSFQSFGNSEAQLQEQFFSSQSFKHNSLLNHSQTQNSQLIESPLTSSSNISNNLSQSISQTPQPSMITKEKIKSLTDKITHFKQNKNKIILSNKISKIVAQMKSQQKLNALLESKDTIKQQLRDSYSKQRSFVDSPLEMIDDIVYRNQEDFHKQNLNFSYSNHLRNRSNSDLDQLNKRPISELSVTNVKLFKIKKINQQPKLDQAQFRLPQIDSSSANQCDKPPRPPTNISKASQSTSQTPDIHNFFKFDMNQNEGYIMENIQQQPQTPLLKKLMRNQFLNKESQENKNKIYNNQPLESRSVKNIQANSQQVSPNLISLKYQ